jgi:transcriptional regulator with XRE-family HTH domain
MKNNILRNIIDIRNKKGYSQEYIATKLDMGQSGYAHIESGRSRLPYDVLLQIADVLEMDIIDVILYPNKVAMNYAEGDQINIESNHGKAFNMRDNSTFNEYVGKEKPAAPNDTWQHHCGIASSHFGTGNITNNDVAALLNIQKGMQSTIKKNEEQMDLIYRDLKEAVIAKDAQITALNETIKNLQRQMDVLIEKCLTKTN